MAELTCMQRMFALITGKYFQQYKIFKRGRPDNGDAQWLCRQGIDTENKLRKLLGLPEIPDDIPNNNTLILFIIIIAIYFWLKR